jgi:hypothetical protein
VDEGVFGRYRLISYLGVAVVILAAAGITGYLLRPHSPATAEPVTPVVPQTALEGLLLSPDQINTATGATRMTVLATYRAMGDSTAEVSDKACLPLVGPGQAAAYARSGWSAVRAQTVSDHRTGTVLQRVVLFSSAHDADAFFTASAQSWPACSNRQYTHTAAGKTQVLTVGPVSTTNGTLSATITGGKGLTGFCERALAVANNVAIDVDACSHGQSDAAVTIAGQIAAKVPTT